MKIRILSQYSENYAAHNEGWDGVSEGWKPKGGVEFSIDISDAQYEWLGISELEEIVRDVLDKKSNKVAKYEYVDMDRVYEEPEDITELFKESFDKLELGDEYTYPLIHDDETTHSGQAGFADGGNVSNDIINHNGKDIYVLKHKIGQDWTEAIRDFFNAHDGKVNKKVWDDTISALKQKESFRGLLKGWKEYKEMMELEVKYGFYINPYFKDGGEIGKEMGSAQLKKINKELQDFDLDNLNPYEDMVYNDMLIKGSRKVDSLQIIINSVEGDYSQLSDELADIAERQDDAYANLGENDIEEEVMANGGKVKKRAKFSDKVEAIADSLHYKKVPKKYQKEYGTRYSREEAEQAGRRIAGAMLKKEIEGYENGGSFKKRGG